MFKVGNGRRAPCAALPRAARRRARVRPRRAQAGRLLGKRGSDGEPPPLEDIERLDHFRAALEHELASPHRLADLAVDGDDLIALGFQPGPALGRALQELLEAVVDDPGRNTRDQLLAVARRLPACA